MSLINNLRIQEQRNRSLKRSFFVFYEGNKAERSFVDKLKQSFSGLIITPLELGIQISKDDIVAEFVALVESSGDVYVRNIDRIIYICDLDNVLETTRNMDNFLNCHTSDEIDVYYTYPCIELLCHIYNEDIMVYKNFNKDDIKSNNNIVVENLGLNCFSGSKFNDKFLNMIVANDFETFIRNSEKLIDIHYKEQGDFGFNSIDEKYVCGKVTRIANSNINHTTLHEFIKVLQNIDRK